MKENVLKKIVLISLVSLCSFSFSMGQGRVSKKDLTIHFDKDAKIEVGSFYAGLEFHHSFPVPQRFSLYYPVANSIDLSTDYWKRDTTFAMNVGIKFGEAKTEWINKESLSFDLTPFSVVFYKTDEEKQVTVSYGFTKDKPAVVISYAVKNISKQTKNVEVITQQALTFRTSHTFNWSRNVDIRKVNSGEIVYVHHNDAETKNATMFIVNPGLIPAEVNYNLLDPNIFPGNPVLQNLYKKSVAPGETFTVTQVVGTCYANEEGSVAGYLQKNYKSQVDSFENYVLDKISKASTFSTGDKVLDKSVLWSKAILEVNKHYIDGEIMPMPCPAEYNFYFTHDVLLTDLAAVNFDLARVENDLRFITKLANKDKIIPHAYYWKDSAFVTEFADHDNWNNFWFIIVSSEYLKHSGNKKMLNNLYPYIEKSLAQALKTKGDDDLMWSYRPDWWDIGKRFGQRSYMTILAIKALRSFVYISSVLDKNAEDLKKYEELSTRMTVQLNDKLYMDKYGYLMNYSDPNIVDEHYYSGSLLAAHYGLLDKKRVDNMVLTAGEKIVDPKVGVYTAFPMDFDELQEFWHFVDNEAGAKYYYLNGGIWPHSNAWYALSLIAGKRKTEAADFIKNVMTIDGIMNGPNGQPAMYEVRNGNSASPKEYGTIDKPQFMWAAGWYIYSLYYLFGIDNNEWNIQFDPFLVNDMNSCSFDITAGGKLSHVIVKKGDSQSVRFDGKKVNSFVLPANVSGTGSIVLQNGSADQPMIKSTNSVLQSCSYKSSVLEFKITAFKGHENVSCIISKVPPKDVLINGKVFGNYTMESVENAYLTTISFKHTDKTDSVKIKY